MKMNSIISVKTAKIMPPNMTMKTPPIFFIDIPPPVGSSSSQV